MMTKKTSTKTVNFSTPRSMFVLGHGYVIHYFFSKYSTLSEYSTVIPFVLRDYNTSLSFAIFEFCFMMDLLI